MKRRLVSLFLLLTMLFSIWTIPVQADTDTTPLFNGTLRTSVKGIEMIQSLEGFIGQPWHDVSQYSIGYGCSTDYAKKYGFPTDSLTKEQGHQLMLFVLDEMEDFLDAFLSQYNISVTQYQYDALMSLTYNLGKSWLTPTSRLGELLVNGGYSVNELACAFAIYCHTGTGDSAVIQTHLVQRRNREAQLFLYNAYNYDAEASFCRLTYKGNTPGNYTDVALYQQGQPYGILFEPDPDTANAAHFIGWYTAEGQKITASTIVSKSITVEPRWSDTYEDPELTGQEAAYSPAQWINLTEKQYVNGVTDGETAVGGSEPEGGSSNMYEASDVFSDLSSDAWYYDYVNDLYNQGVISGYEDNTFRPERTVTTGEALKMILLASGYWESEPVTNHWASGYHYLALEFSILERGDITDLDVPVTRAMMAKIAANALGIEQIFDISPFSDSDNKYACALHDWGITEGYEDGTFRPERSLTRAELATIVWRIHREF